MKYHLTSWLTLGEIRYFDPWFVFSGYVSKEESYYKFFYPKTVVILISNTNDVKEKQYKRTKQYKLTTTSAGVISISAVQKRVIVEKVVCHEKIYCPALLGL